MTNCRTATAYTKFIHRKSQLGNASGFAPLSIPDFLFDFQKELVEWSCLQGRDAARMIRNPSDLNPEYSDERFKLPELIENEIIVKTAHAREGMLFSMPAMNLREERAERRSSLVERCEKAAEIANGNGREPSVIWCQLNSEADHLVSIMPGSVQVSGSSSVREKEEKLNGFSCGHIKKLIIKPKIGAWELNWQHCSNVILFPSHSYEQYYQLVRRCYRFGQTKPVKVSIVASEGERGILDNLRRKQQQTSRMYDHMFCHMKDALHLVSRDSFPETERIPEWAASIK